jgi:hypothetical protein
LKHICAKSLRENETPHRRLSSWCGAVCNAPTVLI